MKSRISQNQGYVIFGALDIRYETLEYGGFFEPLASKRSFV